MATETLSLYIPGQSFFHKISPYTKLVLALSFMLSAFLTNNIWLLLVLFLLSVTFLIISRVFVKAISSVFRFVFMMFIALFIIQSFWYTGGESPIIHIGPLPVKTLGFLFASFVALRLLVVICCFYVLLYTTHPGDLVVSLENHGWPPKFSYLFLATLQSIGELQGRLKTITEVQQCRGVEISGNIIKRAGAYLPLMGPLVVGSLLSIESRALALEVRGFSSNKRTHLRLVHEYPWEKTIRFVLILLPFVVLALRWTWKA